MPSSPRFLFHDAVRDARMPVTVKAVGWCLFGFMSPDGTAAPSVPTLADGVGCSERSVQRALRRLEAAGLLVVERRSGRPSVYRTGDTAMSPLPRHGYDGGRGDMAGPRSRKSGATAMSPEPRSSEPSRARARDRTVADLSDEEFREWVDRGRA